jgi:hypothetical protein
LCLNGLQKN